jgi:hypothetical protein
MGPMDATKVSKPQNWEKDEKLVEAFQATIVAYAILLKIAQGAYHWTLESNKHN